MDNDKGADTGRDGRWLSYADLAGVRGIDKPSAMKLALRHKWQRRKDNRGRMQVYVPGEWLPSSAPRENKSPDMGIDFLKGLANGMATMNEGLAKLTEQIGKERELAAIQLTAANNRISITEAALTLEQEARKQAETAREAAEARVRELEARQVRGFWDRIQAAILGLDR